MKIYNYRDEMYDDIQQYIEDNIDLADYEDAEELEEALNDELWAEDSVTGNASGSYTFDRAKAREYVLANMDLLAEMCSDFGIDNSTIGEKFINEDWEYFDVSIRCYLLGEMIGTVIEKERYFN